MTEIKIYTIDDLFKARTKGAKDKRRRKKRPKKLLPGWSPEHGFTWGFGDTETQFPPGKKSVNLKARKFRSVI